MAFPKIGYDDYLRLANEKELNFLHRADELPPDRSAHALWQCRRTGEIIARSYHQVLTGGDTGSHGQNFLIEYIPKYRELASQLGIEFLFDETVDVGPSNTKSPVKWRGANGDVVVTSYHSLAYGKITKKLAEALGLEPVS